MDFIEKITNKMSLKNQEDSFVSAIPNRLSVLRIIFRAYNHKVLANLCPEITADLQSAGYSACTVSLPTKIRKYCILTSPHVYKKARDHFEIRTHKRIIDVIRPQYDQGPCGMRSLLYRLKETEIPAGVDIRIVKASVGDPKGIRRRSLKEENYNWDVPYNEK